MSKKNIKINIFIFLGSIILMLGFVNFAIGIIFIPDKSLDYTKKLNKEYKLNGLSSIAIDSKNYLYCLSENIDKINVYDTKGNFQFSLAIPYYQRGTSTMSMQNDILYVKSKNDIVYMYRNGVYIGKDTAEHLMLKNKQSICSSSKVAYDIKGNLYKIGYLSVIYPRIEKEIANGRFQEIVYMDFVKWITMSPFPSWIIFMFGGLIYTIGWYKQKKKVTEIIEQ